MVSIENYNKQEDSSNNFSNKESCTVKVQNFVKYLHEFLPILKEEFEEIAKKSEVKSCKPFSDKMRGLSAIYQAEKDLYYWYVKNLNPKAS